MSKYKIDERKYTRKMFKSYMEFDDKFVSELIKELQGYVNETNNKLVVESEEEYYCGGSEKHFDIIERIPEKEDLWKKRVVNNKINRRQRKIKDTERKQEEKEQIEREELKRLQDKYGK